MIWYCENKQLIGSRAKGSRAAGLCYVSGTEQVKETPRNTEIERERARWVLEPLWREHKVHLIYMLKPSALFTWQDIETSTSCHANSSIYHMILTVPWLSSSDAAVPFLSKLMWFSPLPIDENNPISLRQSLIFHINASGKLVWGPGMENGHDSPYLWLNWVMWLANTDGRKTTGILSGTFPASSRHVVCTLNSGAAGRIWVWNPWDIVHNWKSHYRNSCMQ